MKKSIFSALTKLFYGWGLLALFLFSNQKANSQTLDQSQLIYNGGMSARTLAGYSEWQSFTAGITGTLCQINMGFFNYINGSGTLKIFSGTGTGGTLRQTKPVSIFCASGNCMITFIVSVPVTAGQVYTFQFIPGAGIPDPYGVQVQVPGTYGGGQMGLVDPSGTYPLTFDMVFQTYVNTSPLPVELTSFSGENKNNINHLYWTTASEINNDHFEVQKSMDGILFEEIGRAEGNGSISQSMNYHFDDENPLNGINYYRLKQVDYNGNFEFSKTISIQFKSILSKLRYVDGFIKINNRTKNPIILSIQDASGQLIRQFYISEEEFSFSFKEFSNGIYFLKLIAGNQVESLKIIKTD